MNRYEQNCYLAMPKGELKKLSYDTLRKVGYAIPEDQGKLYIRKVENAPLILIDPRASDIPEIVFDEESLVAAGITGSDILWEDGYSRGRIGTDVPVQTFFPEAQQPELYLGVTKTFAEDIQKEFGRSVVPNDLSGKIIFSKYARTASDYMSDNGVRDVKVRKFGGGIEGLPSIYPNAAGIVDIWLSGATAQDNNIVRTSTIAPVTTRLFENIGKISAFEQRVIDDVRERIYVEAQKMRTQSTAFV